MHSSSIAWSFLPIGIYITLNTNCATVLKTFSMFHAEKRKNHSRPIHAHVLFALFLNATVLLSKERRAGEIIFVLLSSSLVSEERGPVKG